MIIGVIASENILSVCRNLTHWQC